MGSPCCRPLVGMILPFNSPLMRIEKDTVLTHIMERETHLSWKPNFLIITSRYAHSTLSYTLLISSFTAIKPSFPTLFWFMWCMVSKAMSTLSVICLPSTKTLCSSLITSGRIFFNLLARTMEIILYIMLHKLIGLNSVIFGGHFTFGMRHMYVSFKP